MNEPWFVVRYVNHAGEQCEWGIFLGKIAADRGMSFCRELTGNAYVLTLAEVRRMKDASRPRSGA